MPKSIDHEKLRQILANHIPNPAMQDAEEPAFLANLDAGAIRELIDSGGLKEFVSELAASPGRGWCILCGAQRGRFPYTLQGEPWLTDEVIDGIAKDLLSAIDGK